MSRAFLCVATALSTALPATNAAAEILQPVRNWNVDFRDDQCLASRDYGAQNRPVSLGIRPSLSGETYEIIVSKPHSGPAQPTEVKASVDFGHGPIKAWLLTYGTGDGKSVLYQFRISADQMEQATTAIAVTLEPSGSPSMSFALKSIPELLKGLKACTEDLQQYWNSKGESDGRIATGAKPADGRDIRSVFSADDYPNVAQSLDQSGSTQFTLLIDDKGGVAGCHVLKPSGVPVLDAMGCQVIRRRAKFKPALDRAGKPVRSTVTTPPVVWRLEG